MELMGKGTIYKCDARLTITSPNSGGITPVQSVRMYMVNILDPKDLEQLLHMRLLKLYPTSVIFISEFKYEEVKTMEPYFYTRT